MNSDIVALAKEVASSFETQTTNSFDGSLTTPITLYRTGRVLYACIPNGSVHSLITDTFDHLISSLGQDYVGMMLLHELHVAYANLIVSFSSSTPNPSVPDTSSLNLLMAQSPGYASKPTACASKDIIEATESLCGVYLASKSACQYCGSFESSESSANELDIVFASFSWVYEYILSDSSMNNMKDNVLKTVSRLLIHGIVHATNDNSEDEQISTIMNIIQRIQSSGGECSCTMGDMLQMEETSDDSFVKNLTSQFSDGPQLQYTMAMLRGFPSSSSRAAANKPTVTKASYFEQTIPNNASRQNMTDIQISHVKGVLPALGEGFIEEALKVYNYDVERTLDALLQVAGDKSNMHPRLRTLPTNLPRKLKDLPEQYTANVNMHRGATAKDDGKEHVQRQKQYIKEVERQAEEEAYLVENVSRALGGLRVQGVKNENDDFGITGNEYDDDYDDQYDGVGNDVGGMDEGLYDVDVHNVHQKYDRGGAKNEQEMWRQYNKVIKSVDAESQFWVSVRSAKSVTLFAHFLTRTVENI